MHTALAYDLYHTLEGMKAVKKIMSTDNTTVTVVYEWKSYPDISISDEGNSNITFKAY